MDPVYEIASREASNPAVRVLFNRRLGYDARMYGTLGGDVWPVKLCETVPALASRRRCWPAGVRQIQRRVRVAIGSTFGREDGPFVDAGD